MFLLLLVLAIINASKADLIIGNYGPYIAELQDFNISYPDRLNLSHTTAIIVRDKDKIVVDLNTTIYVTSEIKELKIYVYNGNTTKDVLWNYRLKNPCQHYTLGTIFRIYYNVNKECIIQKGTYRCVINFTDLLQTFFGPSFFYGSFMFKSTTMATKGRLMAALSHMTFRKK